MTESSRLYMELDGPNLTVLLSFDMVYFEVSTLTIDAAAKAAAASPAKSEPGFDSSIFHDGLATVYSSALPQVP